MTPSDPNQGRSSFATLLRNAVFNTGGFGVKILVTFLATPFFVYKLTPEGYGIFVLLTGLTGYYSILELGLGQGVTKFVAQHFVADEYVAMNHSINAALIIQIVSGAIASSALIFFAPQFLSLLNVAPDYLVSAKKGIYIVAIGFFCQMIAGTLTAAVKGLQRYDLTGKITIFLEFFSSLTMVFVLLLGYGLVAMIVVTTCFSVISLVIYWFILRREIPQWKIMTGTTWASLRQITSFSGFVFLSRITTFLSDYVVRVVISSVLGPAAVTYYVVPLSLLKAIDGVLGNAFSVIFPFASELGAKKDNERLKKIWLEGSRFLLSIALPAYLFAFIFSRPILNVWMGSSFAALTWGYLSLQAVRQILASVTMVPIHIATGLGYVRVRSIFAVLSISLYALLLVPLTQRYGITGAIVATIVGGLPGLIFVAYISRYIIRDHLRDYVSYTLALHIPFILIAGMGLYFLSGYTGGGPLYLFSLVLATGGFLSIYLATMLFTGWLPSRLTQPIRKRLFG